ncbi:MAG: acetolactate synthase small subunit, partial [Deltaproteobacteria bacterium]|nr:acetolactate synthase small subunit [Deltaproteobacteria bacterium]
YVDREIILVRTTATAEKREEVLRITDIFRGKVVDVTHDTITLEVTGSQSKIEAILQLLAPVGILELVRAGTVAIPRAKKSP